MRLKAKKISFSEKTKKNLYFLTVKVVALVVKILPCKPRVVTVLAVLSLVLRPWKLFKPKRWAALLEFADHTESRTSGWLYVVRYYLQRETDILWGLLCYEDVGLERYLTVDGNECLREALAKEDGAILLGLHYGPRLNYFMIKRMGIESKALLKRHVYERRVVEQDTYSSILMTKRLLRFDREHTLASKFSEREIVRHLKGGGVVTMLSDIPVTAGEGKGVETELFGKPVKLYDFPFKLALRYKKPLIFYYFRRSEKGGYTLNFSPVANFLTPEEGLKMYTELVQNLVSENPFMWAFNRRFLKKFIPKGGTTNRGRS